MTEPIIVAHRSMTPGALENARSSLQRAVDVIDVLSARGYSKVSLREAQQFR